MKIWEDCSLKEKLDRWLNAERVLVKLPKHVRTEHWNMGHWGIVTECGTVCCAAGHCGLDPWFRKRGLKLKPVKLAEVIRNELYIENSDNTPHTLAEAEKMGLTRGQGGFENDVDVKEFFGDQCHTIFGNGDSRSVNDVIAEIRNHIKSLKNEIKYVKQSREDSIKGAKAEAAAELKARLERIESDYAQEVREIG